MWAGRPSAVLLLDPPVVAGLADLLQELAVGRELQDLVVVLAVAGEPDVAILVDVDAVLGARPVVAGTGPAPAARTACRRRQSCSTGGAALQQRVSGGFFSAPFSSSTRVEGRWIIQTLSSLSTATPADLPEDPSVGQRFRPERLDYDTAWTPLPCAATSTPRRLLARPQTAAAASIDRYMKRYMGVLRVGDAGAQGACFSIRTQPLLESRGKGGVASKFLCPPPEAVNNAGPRPSHGRVEPRHAA